MKQTLTQLIAAILFGMLPLAAFADSVQGEAGPIEITPLIHSSVQLEYDGTVIQVDPWNRLGLAGAKVADLILITDNPGHHLDVDAVSKLSKPSTTVIIAGNGKDRIPHGQVMEIGDTTSVGEITIEAIAAYDIIQGAPEHPRGDANGYIINIGGKRIYFAGVTECVEEVKALRDIDVAFLPLNIPLGRMTPAASAECAKIIDPDVVYIYHYDQDYARRALDPDYPGTELPGGISIAESLDRFGAELRGSGIEFRRGDFYPPLD